jgi:hypothetical protein
MNKLRFLQKLRNVDTLTPASGAVNITEKQNVIVDNSSSTATATIKAPKAYDPQVKNIRTTGTNSVSVEFNSTAVATITAAITTTLMWDGDKWV